MGAVFPSVDAYCGPQYRNDTPISFSQGCRAGDHICATLNKRTKCDKLLSYASGASHLSHKMKTFSRPEIMWKVDCDTSRQDVIAHAKPLGSARDLQLILVVMNVIANVFVGFLIPILLVWHACVHLSPATPCV